MVRQPGPLNMFKFGFFQSCGSTDSIFGLFFWVGGLDPTLKFLKTSMGGRRIMVMGMIND